MNGFAPRITSIKGISEKRRLPRLGKIRLGIKVPNKGSDPSRCQCAGVGCFKCTHPKETPWFVVPPEVQKEYGERPTELDIMAPVNDLSVVFPNAYKFYGSSRGLKCHGNLEIAYCMNEQTKEIEQRDCPCERKDKECKPSAALQVILYKINFGGVYQITSGSFNSMVDIPSGFDFTQCLLGRFAMVPLKLKRVPTITHHDGKKQTHYPLQIHLETNSPEFINALREQTNKVLTGTQYALPPAEEVRPDLEGPVTTDWKDEEEEGQKGIICPKNQMDIDESECEKCEQITSCTAMGKAEEPKDETRKEARPDLYPSHEPKTNGNFTICRKVGKEPEYKVYTKYCQTTCKERKTCTIAQGLK